MCVSVCVCVCVCVGGWVVCGLCVRVSVGVGCVKSACYNVRMYSTVTIKKCKCKFEQTLN